MSGTSVVAIGVLGPKDLISHDETGILVRDDEEEFAQACYKLLLDESKRQRLGASARKWAMENNSKTSVEKLLEIYLRCAGEPVLATV